MYSPSPPAVAISADDWRFQIRGSEAPVRKRRRRPRQNRGVTVLFRPCQGETKGQETLSSQSVKLAMDTVPQEDVLFEAAFLEESASWSSGGALLEESSTASSSIHLLSLGPDPSPRYELTRTYSTGPGADSELLHPHRWCPVSGSTSRNTLRIDLRGRQTQSKLV